MHRLKRPPHANPLAGLPLDRLSHRRADTAWLTERLADPTSRLAFVWREQGAVLPIGERAMRTLLLRPDQAAPLLDRAGQVLFLGSWRDHAHFAVDLSPVDEPTALLAPIAPGPVIFADLREIGTFLPDAEAALIGYARALTFWHRRHRFCGACRNRNRRRSRRTHSSLPQSVLRNRALPAHRPGGDHAGHLR